MKSIVIKIKIRSEESVGHINQASNGCITAKSTLPKKAALRKTIRRKRKEINGFPVDQEFDIPESYKQYVPEADVTINFVLCNSGLITAFMLCRYLLCYFQNISKQLQPGEEIQWSTSSSSRTSKEFLLSIAYYYIYQ